MSINFKLLIFNLLFVLSVVGCKIEAEPIEFAHDQCHFCKMNIVDKEHAAQYVTKKGKQFKFDAIECMVNELKEKKIQPAILLVSDYGHSTMTNAKKATYLVSPAIRSPMGANLSAFSSKEEGIKTQTLHDGKLYSWEDLFQVVQKEVR